MHTTNDCNISIVASVLLTVSTCCTKTFLVFNSSTTADETQCVSIDIQRQQQIHGNDPNCSSQKIEEMEMIQIAARNLNKLRVKSKVTDRKKFGN